MPHLLCPWPYWVSVSIICTSVRVFKLHYSGILCQISGGHSLVKGVMTLFGEIVNFIIAKWCHSDVSTVRVGEENVSLPPICALTLIHWRKCTDTEWCSSVCFLCISSFHGHWHGWNQNVWHSLRKSEIRHISEIRLFLVFYVTSDDVIHFKTI